MRLLIARSLLLLPLTSCFYSAPETASADAVLKLTPSKTSAQADGSGIVNLTIHLGEHTAAGTQVHLEASSGAVNLSADPDTAAARQLDVKFAQAGDLTVPLRVGRVVGPLLLTAMAGDVVAQAQVEMTRAVVGGLAMSLDRSRVRADGLTPINISAQLTVAGSGAHASVGTPVHFAVCCRDAMTAEPAECRVPAFLSVPPFAMTGADDTATARAIPSVAETAGQGGAGDVEPKSDNYFIVAGVDAATCAKPTDNLHVAVPVSVLLEP